MYDLLKLKGQVITSVVQPGDTEIAFNTQERAFVFDAEGDCCSTSWIYDVDGVDNLIGEEIIDVIAHPTKDYCNDGAVGNTTDYDVLVVYTYDLVTAKGICTIDFRNDSNGYYGGYLRLRNE